MIRDTSDQDLILKTPQKKWIKNPWFWCLVVGIITILLVIPSINKWRGTDLSVSLEKVRLAKVNRGDLIREVSAQGKIVASIKPTLYSPAQGRVSLKVRPGDWVNNGDIIAEIHSPELKSQYEQESSKLESLHSEVKRKEIQIRTERLLLKQKLDLAKITAIAARREKQRNGVGYNKGFQSLQKYEKSKDDLQRAELEYQHLVDENELRTETSSLELQINQHDLKRQQLLVDESLRKVNELVIKSPVTGVVGNAEVDEMDVVSQYQAILSVVDLSVYEVDVEVPESHADDLVLGLESIIQIDNKTYRGSLISISPEVKNSKVICKVKFSEDMPKKLRQNQQAVVRIMLETKSQILMVSRGNFLRAGGGSFAYLVDDNVATKTSIATGFTSTSKVEIISGLKEGDIIVVSGAGFFNDKDQVLLVN